MVDSHAEARPDMRRASVAYSQFLVTPTIAKHRIFACSISTFCRSSLIVVARPTTTSSASCNCVPRGVALSQGTPAPGKESGFRYTPTTCFETFPFPRPSPLKSKPSGAARALEAGRKKLARGSIGQAENSDGRSIISGHLAY